MKASMTGKGGCRLVYVFAVAVTEGSGFMVTDIHLVYDMSMFFRYDSTWQLNRVISDSIL